MSQWGADGILAADMYNAPGTVSQWNWGTTEIFDVPAIGFATFYSIGLSSVLVPLYGTIGGPAIAGTRSRLAIPVGVPGGLK